MALNTFKCNYLPPLYLKGLKKVYDNTQTATEEECILDKPQQERQRYYTSPMTTFCCC